MEDVDPPDIFSDDADVFSYDERLSSLHYISSVRLLCGPCKEDGHYYGAEGYCVDCTHHLCGTCFQHHRTPRPMRHHKLLDEQQMPQTNTDKVFKDECTDICSVHGDEILKYFCEDHNILGCTVCVTLEHRTCKMGYIPTLSADLFNTQEYTLFKSTLESMVRKTNSIRDAATRNLKSAKKSAESAFAKIRTFRKEIDSFFDQLEKEISSRLTQISDENQETIAEILKENKIITDKLKKIEKEIKEKEDKVQKCRLFVDVKQLDEYICKLKKDIDTMEKNITIQEVTFKPSDSVANIIRNESETFGLLVCFHESFPLDIDIDYIDDIAVLSRERIAVYNSYAHTIVSIDTKQTPTKVMAQMKSSLIGGLTRVGKNEIAVTTDNGDIQIYSVTNKFVLKKTIRNTGLYDTIVYTNGVFIGCTKTYLNSLGMLSMNDQVMKTLPIERHILRVCYIAVHPDHTTIYVSDWGKQTVTCFTIEGELKGEYTHGYKWEPQGVAVSPDGLVYVSDSKNNNIHILTSDLKPHDVIIGTRYGICGPRGLAVCDRERKLYVGMNSCNSISVFSI